MAVIRLFPTPAFLLIVTFTCAGAIDYVRLVGQHYEGIRGQVARDEMEAGVLWEETNQMRSALNMHQTMEAVLTPEVLSVAEQQGVPKTCIGALSLAQTAKDNGQFWSTRSKLLLLLLLSLLLCLPSGCSFSPSFQ